jgi:hypothetical protein
MPGTTRGFRRELPTLIALDSQSPSGLKGRMSQADIKGRGIAQRCEKLLGRRGIKPLPKPRVAEEILRQSQRSLGSDSSGPPLLAPGRKAALVSLYRDISVRGRAQRGYRALPQLWIEADRLSPAPEPSPSSAGQGGDEASPQRRSQPLPSQPACRSGHRRSACRSLSCRGPSFSQRSFSSRARHC